MINQQDEFLGVDRNSGFAYRVLVLSVPTGLIFFILALFDILPTGLAAASYICILFFNTVFLMPMSIELQRIKKYILNLSSGGGEEAFANALTEKETRDLSDAINSMHRFWTDRIGTLEHRTLSDAAVLDTLPDPLLMINREKAIIGANLAARDLFVKNLNSVDVCDVIGEERFEQALLRVLNGENREEDISLQLELKGKPKFYVKIHRLPWLAKGDIAAVISFYDLRKVLSLEQMQQDFVANASHELRTPISIISGFIETLLTTAKDDEKMREKFLHIIADQTVYMSALVENLLSLSKIELSLNTPPEGKVNVNAVIREVKSALEIKLKARKLNLATRFARLPMIVGDEAQVTQILQNLLDNAVKYAADNSTVTVTTQKVSGVPKNRYYETAGGEAVKIAVENIGITIAEENLARLSERFYRLQAHKDKNIKGTGLGLSIAAEIIKRHKGNLIVSSQDGVTRFEVFLPLKTNGTEALGQDAVKA